MAIKYFNVKNGLTAGPITLDANTGNASATNLSVTGISDLGAIANVNITGGVSGQAIITDGSGNLTFGNVSAAASPAPMPTYIPVGDAITISANYQGLFGYPITIDGTMTVDGVLIDVDDSSGSNTSPGGFNTQLQYNDAGSLAGIATVTYDGTKLSLGNVANVKINGGSNGQLLSTDGAGNLSWTTSGPGGVDTQVQFNDASSFGGNTGFTFNKTTGVFSAPSIVVSGDITPSANITYSLGNNTNRFNNLYLAGNTINLGGATISANATTITFTNPQGGTFAVAGNSTNSDSTLGNVATANYFVGSGNGLSNIQGANISGAVGLATYATTANAVAGANVSGAVSFATTANAVAGANVSGTVASATSASSANAVAGANVSGAVSYATTANSVAGANVSGQVANALVTGTVYTNAQPNITSVGTLTSLTVNGNISANNANITGNIVPTSNNVYSLGSATSYWKDAYIGPGSLYINGVKVLEESSNAIVISADLNQTVKVTSSGSGDIQLQTTGSGVIAVKGPLQIQAGNYITSSNGGPIGFSNPINVDTISSLSANTNLTISANGTGNVQINDDVTISGNLTINGGGGNLSVSSLSVEDNIIDISAETTGTPVNNAGIRVIRGDDPAVQIRWNETTDTWQTTNDGTNYLNIVGSNTTTGNANVGNIGATGGIFTTVAGSLTTAAQPNITSTGTLSSLSVSGNANVGNIGTVALVATGTGSFGANVTMNSNWITNLGYPTANTDAASKQYVDTMVSTGISYHQPVNVATTTTLATATGGTTAYNSPNGAANGIGAYISTTGTFTNIDGANVQTVGTRILVKDEANATWNGVYTYANTTAIVRSSDTDTYGVDLSGTDHLGINDYFFTLGGVVNEGTSFIVSAPTGTITFGTSNIEFSTFSTSQVYDAGTGLSLTGTTFSVNASQTQITAVGTLSSLSVSGNANVGNIGATNGVFTNVSGNGSALTSIAGGNVTGQVSFAATANAVAGGNVTGQVTFAATANAVAGANVSGAVSFATTANAVAGANVSGAVAFATTANAVAGANVSGAVNLANYASTANAVALANVAGIGNIASININGNASTILYGNGVFAAAPVTYGNSNVATFLGSYGSNTITTTGNVSVGNVIGNGQALTGLAGANVVGAVGLATFATTANAVAGSNVTGAVSFATTANAVAGANVSGAVAFATTANAVAGANVSGQVSFAATANAVAGANVSGTVSSATTAGTVTTAAQPNITSLGTLTGLGVNGTITGVNITANTGVFTGNANGISSVQAANIVGTTLSSTVVNSSLTSVGTLSSLTVSNVAVNAPFVNVNGIEVGLQVKGSSTGYVQGAISLSSGTDSGPSARGQGVFLFNSGANTTWYMGTGYASADTFYVIRKGSTTSLDTSAAWPNPGGGGGTAMLTLTSGGALTATSLTETSSMALKENFRPIENPLEKVIQLLGKIYDRKDGSSKDEAGLVAEDVYKIIPNLVKTDANGNPESVFYTRLTVYLLESIKVLNDEIADLKGKKRKSKK